MKQPVSHRLEGDAGLKQGSEPHSRKRHVNGIKVGASGTRTFLSALWDCSVRGNGNTDHDTLWKNLPQHG